MAFRGWSDSALAFFEGLEADNSKTYWQAHKAEYGSEVRAPMEALLEELEPELGDGKIFRPYRDVRFSSDKSPYKTTIAAIIGDAYVQLSASGLAVGAGMWEMAADQLDRYRAAVDDPRSGAKLQALVADARAAGLQVMAHGSLKTAPRDYAKDHPRVELLRYKGFALWREWPPAAWLGTAKVKDRILTFIEDARPVTRWLASHVGPSTLPVRVR